MSDPRSRHYAQMRHENLPPDHLFGRRGVRAGAVGGDAGIVGEIEAVIGVEEDERRGHGQASRKRITASMAPKSDGVAKWSTLRKVTSSA